MSLRKDRAPYQQRGRASQDVIEGVQFEPPLFQAGKALVEVIAAPITRSDALTLTGEYGQL